MFGPTPARDIGLVAGFDNREMLRSRKALAVIALYLMAAAFFTYIFVRILESVQPVVANPSAFMAGANSPAPAPAPAPGSGPAAPRIGGGRNRGGPVIIASPADKPSQGMLLARGSPFRLLLQNAIADKDTMDYLVVQPPLILFFTLTSFAFMPLLIMITVADTVAQEHQTRGVRFVAMRTGRAELVLGKVLGQALLLGLVTLLSGLISLALAAWKLQDFEWSPALSALFVFWPRVFVYTLPFVGLAALCSMHTSSVMMARAGALLALGALWITHGLAAHFADRWFAPGLVALDYLTPYPQQDELWRPGWVAVGTPILLLAWLALGYLAAGLFFYRRRDL